LPHVDNVAIQNEALGLDGFKVFEKLFGMTAVGAQMYI
jgi:hypothetical protein